MELALDLNGIVAEPEPKLRVGKSQLTLVRFRQVAPGFEVVDRHAEFLGEQPQRLDGRRACPRFDPRNVGVRHAGAR